MILPFMIETQTQSGADAVSHPLCLSLLFSFLKANGPNGKMMEDKRGEAAVNLNVYVPGAFRPVALGLDTAICSLIESW